MLAVWERYPDNRVLIVVPTVALMDQWRAALNDELEVSDADIDLIGGGTRRIGRAPVTIGVLDSVRKVAAELTSEGRWFLIVDECHRAGSPANQKIFAGSYAATLGLSATPERQYDDLFESVIVPSLGPIIFRYAYQHASDDGIISGFELWNIQVLPSSAEKAQLNADNRAISMEVKRLGGLRSSVSPQLQTVAHAKKQAQPASAI